MRYRIGEAPGEPAQALDQGSFLAIAILSLVIGTGFIFAGVHRVRHHTLFAPRDFDISPYFRIIKPTLEAGFDHHQLAWAENSPGSDPV